MMNFKIKLMYLLPSRFMGREGSCGQQGMPSSLNV